MEKLVVRALSAALLLIFLTLGTYLSAENIGASSRSEGYKKALAAEAEVKEAENALEQAKEALAAEKKAWKKEETAKKAEKASGIEKEVKESKLALRKAIDILDAEDKARKKAEKEKRSKKVSAAKAEVEEAKLALEEAAQALSIEKKAKKKQEKLEKKRKKIERELAIKTKGKKNVVAEEEAKKKLEKLEAEERKLKEKEAKKKEKEAKKAQKKKAKEEKKARQKKEKDEEKAEDEAKKKSGLTTQAKIDAMGKKIDNIRKKVPEEMLEEQKIKVEPEATANILNGAFSIMVKQRIKKSYLEFGGEYDFTDSFMGFNLDYNYKIGRFYTGFQIKDSIDFNEVYSNSSFLQRVQSITPYTRPRLHKRLFAKLSLGFEDTRTTSLDTGLTLDSGKNVVGQLRFDHNLMQKKKKLPSGIEQSLSFMNSYANLGSDYSYALSEYNFLGVLQLFGDRYIEYKLNTGVPLNSDHKPLSSFYWAGGYKVLKGYDYKEFLGDAIISHRLSYNVPLTKVEYNQILGFNYSVVTWDLAFEAVEIGDREIYYTQDTMKLSAEIGFGYRLVLLKYLPLKLEFILAKALETRPPKAYLLLSTVFYSWSNN